MNCYVCEKSPKVGGTRYGIRPAVGVCHHCGVAVCADHSHRASEPGSPLLCPSCAEFLRSVEGYEQSAVQSV